MKFLKAHKNDILLILAVLLAAGGVWVYTLFTRNVGGEAVVTVDGETVALLPLDKDISYTPELSCPGDDGGVCANVIQVEGGRVRVVSASCPDQVCVRTGWIGYDGEMIVCLPHRLIVTVVGGGSGSVDAVAGG